MEKAILSVAAVLAFGIASAQDAGKTSGGKGFANGDVFITGSVGFSSESEGDYKTNIFTIAPTAGLFVTNNISVGVGIGYASIKDEDPIGGDVDTSFLRLGAFGRYYATPANDFSFFGQLGFDYLTGKEEPEEEPETKVDGFEIALRPGVSYFISEHFAIEASIGALSYGTIEEDDAENSTDTFQIGVDLTEINFGLLYKF